MVRKLFALSVVLFATLGCGILEKNSGGSSSSAAKGRFSGAIDTGGCYYAAYITMHSSRKCSFDLGSGICSPTFIEGGCTIKNDKIHLSDKDWGFDDTYSIVWLSKDEFEIVYPDDRSPDKFTKVDDSSSDKD